MQLLMSREQRRVVGIILLAFIPFALVVATVVQRHTESARAGIVADRLAHARAAANIADLYIDGTFTTLTALAQTRSLRSPASGNVDNLIASIVKSDPSWLVLGLSDAQGWNLS